MNRRQLLKGLGILPIAGAIGCNGESQRPRPARECHTLQITLEGAFAVVLRKQQDHYRITAFSPASPTAPPKGTKCPKELFPIESHQFCFNGEPQRPGNFELLAEGLHLAPRPIIDIGFRDFTAETENWRLANDFVAIDLPSPKTISFYGEPDVVVFAFPSGGHRTGHMPSNHIFEYQVQDPSKITVVRREKEKKERLKPSSESTPDVTKFSFSVGLPPGRDSDGQHAVKFFNYLLCGFFPDLVNAYSLSRADYGTSDRGKPRSGLIEPNGRTVPAVLKYGMHEPHLLTVSQVVDCKSGGIMITTSSEPTP